MNTDSYESRAGGHGRPSKMTHSSPEVSRTILFALCGPRTKQFYPCGSVSTRS